jgi:DNA replication and repair protein RecF
MILFKPDDLKIIKESPALRRKFINIELSQLDRNYILYLNGYNKILKQRNIYLKEMYINGTLSKSYLDIMTEKMVDYGIKIHEIRKRFINKISEKISKNYLKIFEYGNLNIKYVSDYDDKKDNILRKYQQYLKKDMLLGKTTYGVHRDDIEFELDGYSLKDCGSEGQQKNAIIAFKMSEIDIVKEEKGYYPILIFDDLSSELDKNKINNILDMFDDKVQTFITTTSIDYFTDEILNKAKVIKVENSNVEVN